MSGVEQVAPGLGEQFPQAVLDLGEFRGETTIVVRAADILPVCQFLRDDPDLAYDLCLFVSVVDQLQADLPLGGDASGGWSSRFVAVYQLYSLAHQRRLRLQVPLSGRSAHCGQRDLGLASSRLARARSL